MNEYKRYGDEQPKPGKLCWVKRKARKTAGVMRLNVGGFDIDRWTEDGWSNAYCHPNDLWCYAVPPQWPPEVSEAPSRRLVHRPAKKEKGR